MDWLKKAEGLFEVVDQRAKLVASELSDERPNSQSSGSTKKGPQTKGTKSKKKAQKRLSTNESSKVRDTAEDSNKQMTDIDISYSKDEASVPTENKVIFSEKPMNQINNFESKIDERDTSVSENPLSEALADNSVKHDANNTKVQPNVINIESAPSITDGEIVNEDVTVPKDEGVELNASKPINEDEEISKDLSDSASLNVRSKEEDIPSKVDVERPEPETVSASKNIETHPNGADPKVENLEDRKMQPEQKAEKVQEQLEEAKGLLKNAVSTGQSKEARLARVCAGLSTRLQEYKYENAQLEELLNAERELSKSYEACINQLHKELSASKGEITRIESNMAEALAAKNSEIETLLSSMDALKKQAALSEGNLASLQANMESIMRNRELAETRMMQAVREELASVERRAEEERSAHNATKMAAMEREVELEQRAVEASSALARAQRLADERMSKAAELEQKVALLEVECASLNQELQDMEARIRVGQKKAPEEANQVIQMQAWQEEVERARQSQREAENKLSSLEAEMQKMRVEVASMKRDAEHYSRQEHVELEKRYRELTDLLYHKQTQLETMASEKAAAEFQLEKELRRLQEAQVETERNRVFRRASATWEEDTEIKALEPLPLHHRHMIGARVQLQKAAKILDSGAVRATRFLWRYPTARVCLLIYLVFVHLFLMYLLHRLQEQADSNAAREVAESMGLSTSKFPSQ